MGPIPIRPPGRRSAMMAGRGAIMGMPPGDTSFAPPQLPTAPSSQAPMPEEPEVPGETEPETPGEMEPEEGNPPFTFAQTYYHGPEEICDSCDYFQPPSGCIWVQGIIDPQGHCALHSAKSSSQAPSSQAPTGKGREGGEEMEE